MRFPKKEAFLCAVCGVVAIVGTTAIAPHFHIHGHQPQSRMRVTAYRWEAPEEHIHQDERPVCQEHPCRSPHLRKARRGRARVCRHR